MADRVVSMQAPVPYLNRALASEQLGVDAESRGDQSEAATRYQDAVHVSISPHDHACMEQASLTIAHRSQLSVSCDAATRLAPAQPCCWL